MNLLRNIFITEDFWRKMEIPSKKKQEIFYKYFGKTNQRIDNTDDAISYLKEILNRLQEEIVRDFSNGNSKRVTYELLKIHDKCFKNYHWEKEDRDELVKSRIDSSHIQDIYGTNRNVAQDILYGINIWIENSVLLQQNIEEKFEVHKKNIDIELCLLVYVYGTASRSLSFLALSKRLKNTKLYYGIEISPDSSMPINVVRDHPVIYYNPLMAGNQSIFSVSEDDYRNIDNSDFGKGFIKEYGISLLMSLRVFSTFQKYELQDGKIACMAFEKENFKNRVAEMVNNQDFAEKFLDAFSLNKEKMQANLSKNDPVIWKAGVNKYRFELRPIVMLEDDTICISCQAFEQAKQIWMSFFANGGVAYSDIKDRFTEAEEKHNTELSEKLVKMIVSALKEKYSDNFCDTDVRYERIFEARGIDYGDYDVVFYSKNTKELFLVEAKYFSDSLNISGHINDFEKMYKEKGYYEHCRKRYDLVLDNPSEIKTFIGESGPINVYFLFVSSKPLEVELQDEDKIVTIIPFCIIEQFLDGKLISEDGTEVMKPRMII